MNVARVVALSRRVLVALAALTALVMLWWPLGYDQGVFATNGSILLRGGLPYRDAWDVKGPLTFYLFAGIQWVLGPHPWSIRVVDVAVALGTALMLARRLAPLTSVATARTTAAFWVLLVATLTYNDSAQPDLWAATALLGVILLTAADRPYTRRGLAAAGLLVGLMTLTKPMYPVFLAVPALVVLLRRGRDVPALAGDGAALVAGWLMPIAVMLGWLAARGALDDLWDVLVVFNTRVYAQIGTTSVGARVRGVVDFLLKGKVVVVALPPIVVGGGVLWRERRSLAVALFAAVALGIICVVLQAKFFLYHWTLVFPPLVLLGAVGFDRVLRYADAPAAGLRVFGLAALSVVFVHAALRPATYVTDWLAYVTGRRTHAQYYTAFGVGWNVDPAEQRAVARYVQARTRPEQAVAVWPVDAAIPYLAARPPASRFTLPVIMQGPAEGPARLDPITQRYRQEYLAQLEETRPAYFVLGSHHTREGLAPEMPIARVFPALDALLRRDYRLEARIGAAELYRRIEGAAGPRVSSTGKA